MGRSRVSPRLIARRRLVTLICLLAGGVAIASCGSTGVAGRTHARRAPTVVTRDGAVRGFAVRGVDKFLGIPYAAPPVGNLRWRAPHPVRDWRGLRPATQLPPACPQQPNPNLPRGSTDENCLYLSVYRPHGVAARARLPVLFWIHGGGLTTGSGNQHDGSLIVQTNHIIVVSINYRIGVFGFLTLPSLNTEAKDYASGDYGVLDQEAALRWVHANIARFGGDPGNVTIAGESAGAYSVCALLTSPPIRGLFSRAVMESGSCTSRPLAAAEQSGSKFAAAAGCPDPSTAAACLRAKSARVLLAQSDYPSAVVPTVGGTELPVSPARQVARGRFAQVPLLIGTNHDEGRDFTQAFAPLTRQQYEAFARSSYGTMAPRVLSHYPWSAYPRPYTASYAIGAIWTDSGFVDGIGGCATQRLEQQFRRHTRVFAYQFDDRQAPGLDHKLPGYEWGAGHAVELAYMWPSFDNGFSLYAKLTPVQRALSRHMVSYWGAFVRSGAPQVAGLRHWPDYRTHRMLSLRDGGRTVAISDAQFAREHQCGFWDSLPAR